MNNAKNETGISGWWKDLKATFRRIIWPTRDQIIQRSAVVIAISVVLGIIIAALDRVLLLLTDLIISI